MLSLNLTQVPLVIFKREKEIARKLEFEGLYIVEQPSDDDIKAHWDKLVLSTQSFPESYWDKFVKKKVLLLLNNYQLDFILTSVKLLFLLETSVFCKLLYNVNNIGIDMDIKNIRFCGISSKFLIT